MDFSAEGILARMKAALKNEDTKKAASQWIIFRRWLRSLPGLMP